MDATVRKKDNSDIDIDTIVEDIAVLKKDIAKVLEHLKTSTVDNAVDSAASFAEHLTDEAADLYKDLSKRGQKTAKAIARQVEDQPGTSLLIAFAAGFLVSRFTR
jgi:ElaB/YqjD/DUF883 family membrane-anchored ribosome-binding protein